MHSPNTGHGANDDLCKMLKRKVEKEEKEEKKKEEKASK